MIYTIFLILFCPIAFANIDCQSIFKTLPNEEIRLREKGIKEEFTAYVNDVDRIIQVGKEIQKIKNLDAFQTHIPYFEEFIDRHIDWVREGIKNKNIIPSPFAGIDIEIPNESKENHASDRIFLLEKFYQHILDAVKNKKLTYAYWILWNDYLSEILVAHYKIDTREMDMIMKDLSNTKNIEGNFRMTRLSTVINSFPQFIALPIPSNKLGFIALNRAADQKVVPISLSNQMITADNVPMDPRFLFYHDIFHSFVESKFGRYNLFEITRNQKFLSSLTAHQRELLELMLFYTTHETNFLKEKGSLKELVSKTNLANDHLQSFLIPYLVEKDVINMKSAISKRISDKYFKWFTSTIRSYLDTYLENKDHYTIEDLPQLDQKEKDFLQSF